MLPSYSSISSATESHEPSRDSIISPIDYSSSHSYDRDKGNDSGSPPTIYSHRFVTPNNILQPINLHDYEDNDDSAFTLTRLMDSKPEDLLNSLSVDQLIQLGENVRKFKEPNDHSSSNQNAKNTNLMIHNPRNMISRSSNSSTSDIKEELNVDEEDGFYEMLSMADVSSGSYNSLRSRSMSDYNDSSYRKSPKTSSNVLNLPASMPITDVRGGVEYIIFTYSTKGHAKEYSIRVDIENVIPENLPEDFKRENCVYPRACVSADAYIGNRYEYETKVNDLAWRLTWLNSDVLSGKRGLIQRAVDSFRNRFQESRSRRVIRQDKINNGTLRRRASDAISASLISKRKFPYASSDFSSISSDLHSTIQYENKKGKITTTRVNLDVDRVDLNAIDEKFRANNCLFPNSMLFYENNDNQSYIYECAMNELAWKLAYLNPNKLAGKRIALLAAIEAFQEKTDPTKYESYDESHSSRRYLNGYQNDCSGFDTNQGSGPEFLPPLSHVHGYSMHSILPDLHHSVSYDYNNHYSSSHIQ